MQQEDSRRFVFTATGSAYFRIWIVNLMLSIVTLGFYSPWAKVRRIRYFYGSTLFDGSPFEFHGNPLALLKGRVIGLVLLIAYTQAAKFSVTVWFVVVAALIAIFPWLLWKSLRFRLANTSYRGIRFGFDGTIGAAYATFVPLMLMVVGPTLALAIAQSTLGLAKPSVSAFVPYIVVSLGAACLAPWFYFRLRAFQHRHARLGESRFDFDGRVRAMYGLAARGLGIALLFAIVGSICGAIVAGGGFFLAPPNSPLFKGTVSFLAILVGYIFLFGAASCIKAMIQNFVWSRTTLAGSPFTSDVGRFELWNIEAGNIVLTLVTFGFFWPFAVVRSMRYRIEALGWSGDSDAVVARAGDSDVGATGEEAADLFGLDLAL